MLNSIFYGFVVVKCIVFNDSLFATDFGSILSYLIPDKKCYSGIFLCILFYLLYFHIFNFDSELLCKNSLGKFFNSLYQIFNLDTLPRALSHLFVLSYKPFI